MMSSRMWKKQPTESEKAFTNYISDEGITSRMNKAFLQLNNKMINKPI